MQQMSSPEYAVYRFSRDIRARLAPLKTLNNTAGPRAILADWIVIVGAITLSELTIWALPLTLLLIGSRQRALASLLHEGAHGVLAKSRELNRFLAEWTAGYPIFQIFDSYRHSHVEGHHKHLGDPYHDPDLGHYIMTGLYDVRDRHDFFWKHFLKTVIFLNVPHYLRYLVEHRLGNVLRDPTTLVRLAATHAIITVALGLTVGWHGYVLYWLLPFLTTFQVIGWLSEIAEHYDLFSKADTSLAISRNRFPTWWERAFIGMHADNYHLTHHLFPLVPFWNLPKAHGVLMADENYARLNTDVGGIVSAPLGRRSVLSIIMTDIYAKPPAHGAKAARVLQIS